MASNEFSEDAEKVIVKGTERASAISELDKRLYSTVDLTVKHLEKSLDEVGVGYISSLREGSRYTGTVDMILSNFMIFYNENRPHDGKNLYALNVANGIRGLIKSKNISRNLPAGEYLTKRMVDTAKSIEESVVRSYSGKKTIA